MRPVILFIIWFYKYFLSPFLPAACRFTPTCSEYALEAVKEHGSLKGTWLAFRRVLRCNPFTESCHDPVPKKD
jgi:putative membrane protein insertion efficiency factor